MLRPHGWDLPSARAELRGGELIRVIEQGRLAAELYRDGTFIVEAQIHQDFLAWSDKTDSQFHPLALIELIVNFTRFYRSILDDFLTPPNDIQFRVELRNMHLGNRKTTLSSGTVETHWPLGGGEKEAPSDSWTKGIIVAASFDEDRLAYALAKELYVWFGHSEEAIPYVTDTLEGKSIDVKRIQTIH